MTQEWLSKESNLVLSGFNRPLFPVELHSHDLPKLVSCFVGRGGVEPPLPGPKPGVIPFHYIPFVVLRGFEPRVSWLRTKRVSRYTTGPWQCVRDSNSQVPG